MKIGFHTNALSIRGTEVALYDYALYNESLLGNTSYIFVPQDSEKDVKVLNKFQKTFNTLIEYTDMKDLEHKIESNNIDMCYFIKRGEMDGKLVRTCRSVVHVVFQVKQVHGNVYAYISEWLAKKMKWPYYVPHMVNLPEPNGSLREKLNISKFTRVIGRYGGWNEFDIEAVKNTVIEIADNTKDIVFLFMNTKPFCDQRSNIVFIEGTSNLQNKANFIETCDAMLHARGEGESFGLAIAEFLSLGKQVYTWNQGIDQNHFTFIDRCNRYDNKKELVNLILNGGPNINYRGKVEAFKPISVMNQFKAVFIDGVKNL